MNDHSILIIADSKSDIEILVKTIGDLYEVNIVMSAQDALSFFEESTPSLIILDAEMQGMDGYEICRKIRENQKTHLTPIIMITGKDCDDDIDKGLDEGVDFFITKPLAREVLFGRIFAAFRKGSHNREKEKIQSVRDDITTLLHTESEIEHKLQEVVHVLKKQLNVDVCSIFLYDSLADSLVLEATSGLEINPDIKFEIIASEGVSGWVVKNRQYVNILDLKTWSDSEIITDININRYKSLLSMPIVTNEDVHGVINFQTIETREFNEEEVQGMAMICSQLADAIHNEALKKKLQVNLDSKESNEDIAADDFVGKGQLINRTNKFVSKMAMNNEPSVITGEIGTGKGLISKMIHLASPRKNGPYIKVDCSTFQKETRGEELVGREIEEYGSLSIVKRGLFEKADKGTLMLDNIEQLDNVSQIKLLMFIESGTFKRLPNNTLKKSNVKIITSTNVNLKVLVNDGLFDDGLYDVLMQNEFKTNPLRKMKRDIPELCNYFLKKLCREYNKPNIKLSEAAEKKIQSYDWPGNVSELEAVLERAVVVSGKEIEKDMLYFYSQTERDKPTYNLFNYSWLAKILKMNIFPDHIGKVVLVGFWVSIFFLLLYPQNNTLNSAFWSLGWFSLFLTAFLFGRIFCSICPFMGTAEIVRKFKSFEKDRPVFAANHGHKVITVLIILIFWMEGSFSFYSNSFFTAILLLSITLGAVVCSIFYLRRVWCRYLCPTGNLIGIFSLTSFLSVSADKHVCMYRCKTHNCYTGTETEPGCQLYLHPYAIENPSQCVSCMQCHKNCPNDSVKLNLQFPGTGFLSMSSSTRSFAFLTTVLLGILPVEYAVSLLSEFGFQVNGENKLFIYSATFILFACAPIFMLLLIERIFGRLSLKDSVSRLSLSVYSLLPMALFGYLSLYGMKSVAWVETMITDSWGLHIDFFSANFVFKTFAVIGVIIGMIGTIHSFYRLYRSDIETFAVNRKMVIGYCLFLCLYLISYIATVLHS
ncbi:MAG: sigma 54-interacting transcriptional regulator [Nitrospinae bacterium]|nr:sigma 54-interacting transcriptional regulator [Nitrospinota bacterium]